MLFVYVRVYIYIYICVFVYVRVYIKYVCVCVYRSMRASTVCPRCLTTFLAAQTQTPRPCVCMHMCVYMYTCV